MTRPPRSGSFGLVTASLQHECNTSSDPGSERAPCRRLPPRCCASQVRRYAGLAGVPIPDNHGELCQRVNIGLRTRLGAS